MCLSFCFWTCLRSQNPWCIPVTGVLESIKFHSIETLPGPSPSGHSSGSSVRLGNVHLTIESSGTRFHHSFITFSCRWYGPDRVYKSTVNNQFIFPRVWWKKKHRSVAKKGLQKITLDKFNWFRTFKKYFAGVDNASAVRIRRITALYRNVRNLKVHCPWKSLN